MAVKTKNNGFNKYKEAFKKLNSKKVAVGLFETAGKKVITRGIVNEFGTENAGKNKNVTIPERSFVRSTYNKNYKKVAKDFTKIAKNISRGNYNVNAKLKEIGLKQELEIKKTINSLKIPSNALSTIKNKGFDNPLIETGEMRDKVSSKLVNKKVIGYNERI